MANEVVGDVQVLQQFRFPVEQPTKHINTLLLDRVAQVCLYLTQCRCLLGYLYPIGSWEEGGGVRRPVEQLKRLLALTTIMLLFDQIHCSVRVIIIIL